MIFDFDDTMTETFHTKLKRQHCKNKQTKKLKCVWYHFHGFFFDGYIQTLYCLFFYNFTYVIDSFQYEIK